MKGERMSDDRGMAATQSTLAATANIRGRGLFHGIPAKVRIHPAPENHGIVFRRVDLTGRPTIDASVDNVRRVPRRTVITDGGHARVETIEHLMSALAGLRVTNCLIDVSGPELPAVDGSALPYCEAILEAGLCAQSAAASVVRMPQPIAAAEDSCGHRIEVTASPDHSWSITYRLEFDEEGRLPAQSCSVTLTPDVYLNEIAAARTFVFAEEVEALQKNGFGKHLTESDLLVFDDQGQVVGNSLRWNDEPVRHKVLDCLGDLYLSGGFVDGTVIAYRSGHALNHVMAGILSPTRQQATTDLEPDRLAA